MNSNISACSFSPISCAYLNLLIAIILNVGGAMASWLVRSTPERAVWVRSVVFLGKTLYSHSASLHPGV